MSDALTPVVMPSLEEAAARATAARQKGHSRILLEMPPNAHQFHTMVWRSPSDPGVLGRIVGRRTGTTQDRNGREVGIVTAHVVSVECVSVIEAWRRAQLRRINEQNGTAAAPVRRNGWRGVGR